MALMTKKSIFITAAVLSVAIIAYTSNEALGHYEGPPYEVVKKLDGFEIRRYQPRVVASVDLSGEYEKSLNNGFRILAGYIFGKNGPKSKISMTAPVVVSQKIPMTAPVAVSPRGEQMTMRFFMPSKYTLETLPEPLDDRIKLSLLPAQTFAAVKFSGIARDADFKERGEALVKKLEAAGIKVDGEPVWAYYNPPFTLPFMRRNEVMLPIVVAE